MATGWGYGGDGNDDLIAQVQNVNGDFDLNANYIVGDGEGLGGDHARGSGDAIDGVLRHDPVQRDRSGDRQRFNRRFARGSTVDQRRPQISTTSRRRSKGSGVNGTLTLEGSAEAIGTFNGDPFGLGSGIILSTGRVADLPGENTESSGGEHVTSIPIVFEKIGSVRNVPPTGSISIALICPD